MENEEMILDNEEFDGTEAAETENVDQAPEIPYARNTTTISDEINRSVLLRISRGQIILNALMIAAGIAVIVILIVVNNLSGAGLFSSASNITELVICAVLIAMGVFGLVSVLTQINNSVNAASEFAARRQTEFYEDRILVTAGLDESEIPADRFVKLAETGKLFLFYFKSDNSRMEIFILSKDGFESEEDKAKVLERFGRKKREKNKSDE